MRQFATEILIKRARFIGLGLITIAVAVYFLLVPTRASANLPVCGSEQCESGNTCYDSGACNNGQRCVSGHWEDDPGC